MYTIRQAMTAQEIEDVYRLRFLVFCIQLGWLPPENYPEEKESDEFDPYSVHFLAYDSSDVPVGTIRVITHSRIGLQITKHFDLQLDNWNQRSVEISRLAILEEMRGDLFLMLGLCRAIYHWSKDNEVTDWYAVVDRRLLTILHYLGWPFEQIAPSKFYFGDYTIPTHLTVSIAEESTRIKRPRLYEFFQVRSNVVKEGIK